jgi:aspartyl/asparaginyl-tRNA synthetase
MNGFAMVDREIVLLSLENFKKIDQEFFNIRLKAVDRILEKEREIWNSKWYNKILPNRRITKEYIHNRVTFYGFIDVLKGCDVSMDEIIPKHLQIYHTNYLTPRYDNMYYAIQNLGKFEESYYSDELLNFIELYSKYKGVS